MSGEEPGGWNAIESAPKDGATVFLWDGSAVHRGSWVDVPFEEHRDELGRYVSQTDHWCGWVSHDTGEELEPTHWQKDMRPKPPLAAMGELGE